MHILSRFILTIAVLFSLFAHQVRVDDAAPTRAILILDASGSMWGQIDGVAKIEIARKAVAEIINQAPDTALRSGPGLYTQMEDLGIR